MPRKKKVEPDVQATLETAKEAFDGATTSTEQVDGIAKQTPTEAENKRKGLTLVVPLTDDGAIDSASMRDKTKEKTKTAYAKSPEFWPASGATPQFDLPDMAVDAVYSIVGMLEVMAASTRMPAPVAERIFTYTEEEVRVLRPPTAACLKKWLPATMKYQEETALILCLAQVHFMKLQMVRHFFANQAQDGTQRNTQAQTSQVTQ